MIKNGVNYKKLKSFFYNLGLVKPTMSTYTRQPSPFIVFCHANRAAVRAANPSAKFGDMGKLLADLWKGLSAAEKGAYDNTNTKPIRPRSPSPDTPTVPGLRRSARLRNQRLGRKF
jgi:hypothetical protein